jgi:hypothetical protein
MKKTILIPLFLLLLHVAVDSHAASVVVVPGGNGVYYVKATDFVDVGGVEIEVQYDTATLTNPRITQGSLLASTMFIPNPKFSPSSVKIASMSLSPINGSGDLAVLSFDVKGSKAGYVNIVRSKLAAATGAAVKHDTVTATASTGSQTGSAASSPATATGTETASVGGGSGSVSVGGTTSASVGSITLPQDQMASTDRKTEYQPLVTDLRKDMTIPLPGAETGATTATAKAAAQDKGAEKKFESFTGVLQLFKAFKGERTMKALISLFADAEVPNFKQTPAVAIADGKTPLTITLVLKPSGNETPKFIMQGASVKKLSSDGEEVTWTVEAVPKKDVFEAKLTVIDGARMLEYPLTVTPKIDPALTKGKKLSEADFKLYLAKPPKFDFNLDKKFDAIDDFIYTANYIAALKIKPEKSSKDEAKEKKPAEKKESPDGKELKAKDGKVKAGEAVTPKSGEKIIPKAGEK